MFVQVFNRGVSLLGQRLRARNWVFLYTPKELWEEVERLADPANQNSHEGLGNGKNAQQNAQGGANRSDKKVNDTEGDQQECGSCLLLGSAHQAKSHSTENHRWSVSLFPNTIDIERNLQCTGEEKF